MRDGKKVILLVEDEQSLLESYGEILEGVGFEVLKAQDGYEGMKLIEDNKEVLDMILLDLMMPGIDGLEVLKSIKDDTEKYGEVPVVILTAMVSDKVIEECYEYWAVSYLIKSELNTEEFINEVERLLE